MLRLLLLCRFHHKSLYPVSPERIRLRFPGSYVDLLFLLKVPVRRLVPKLRSELPVSALLNKHRFRKVFRLFRHLRSRYRLLRLYHSKSQDLLSSYVLQGLPGLQTVQEQNCLESLLQAHLLLRWHPSFLLPLR